VTWPVTLAPLQHRLAGFWIRTLAYLLDGVMLGVVGGALSFLVGNSQGQQSNAAAGGSGLLSLLYFGFFWSRYGGGGTLGQRLLGLRVIHTDGSQLGLLGALVRWFGLWFSFLVCFVGVIWVAFDASKQGWHDKLANTVVVHV
jgi:uncharacterized RDD family membrane protein YckC